MSFTKLDNSYSKRPYIGLKMGPGYMNLTKESLEIIATECDRVDILYDEETKRLAINPTEDPLAYSLNQSIHCRPLLRIPWKRYYYLGRKGKLFVFGNHGEKL